MKTLNISYKSKNSEGDKANQVTLDINIPVLDVTHYSKNTTTKEMEADVENKKLKAVKDAVIAQLPEGESLVSVENFYE